MANLEPMKGESEIFNELIADIKADYPLTPASLSVLQLNEFSILERGDGFRLSYCWEAKPDLYVFSVYNSYRTHKIDPAAKAPSYVSFKYLYCFRTLRKGLPDTIIRPNSLGEKFANLFIHTHTPIPHHSEFNNKYLVETTAPGLLIGRLPDDLLQLIKDFDEFYLEIRDNTCLLLHLRPANYADTVQLIEISKNLLAI